MVFKIKEERCWGGCLPYRMSPEVLSLQEHTTNFSFTAKAVSGWLFIDTQGSIQPQ